MKADREEAGLTVQQLAQATRIMANFVEALEQDNLAALPGKVFAKGFIKSIYKVLGKDPGSVIEQFDSDNGIEQARVVPVTHVERVQTDIVRKQSRSKPLSMRVIAGAAVAGILLVGLIWMAASGEHKKEEANVRTPATKQVEELADQPEQGDPAVAGLKEATVESTDELADQNIVPEEVAAKVADPEVEVKEDPTAAQEVVAAAPDVEAMQADATTNQGQLIEITVKKTVKIRMNIDQKGWETNELVPDTYQFRFEDVANLLLFNAAAVEMTFNGRNLGPLGDEGRVRRLSFVAGSPEKAGKM
jgi:cytoskeleton protein RodZ